MRTWLTAILLASAACFPSSAVAQWYASADFMPLRRPDSSDAVFQRNQTLETTTGTAPNITITPPMVGSETLLGSHDVELDFAAAGRITVGRRFQEGRFGLEVSYLVADTWTSSAALTSASGMASPFSAVGSAPDPDWDDNTSVEVVYRTQMQSAEAHVTMLIYGEPDAEATLLVGVRAMSIDEWLTYDAKKTTGDPATEHEHTILTNVNNRLIGPQVGVLGRIQAPGGFVCVNAKGALLWNTMDANQLVDDGPFDIHDADAALLGELSFEYIYYPLPRLGLRLGYHLLGVTEVGLATDNLSREKLTNVETSCVLYHGPRVGLLLNY
jgi:hypothetical protein